LVLGDFFLEDLSLYKGMRNAKGKGFKKERGGVKRNLVRGIKDLATRTG